MAAKPNEPPMQTLRKWIAVLEQAIAKDDRVTIRAVLKDAVPEFGSNGCVIRHATDVLESTVSNARAEAGKNRHRQPALPAGSQHHRGYHGGDRQSSGCGSAGAGAVGNARLRLR